MHGETLFGGVEARAARHRPTPQHATVLEPQIVVQARGVVLVNDENTAGRFA